MIEELVIHGIRINKAAGQGDLDSRMTSFEVIMPLKLESTIYESPIIRCIALSRLVIREKEWRV